MGGSNNGNLGSFGQTLNNLNSGWDAGTSATKSNISQGIQNYNNNNILQSPLYQFGKNNSNYIGGALGQGLGAMTTNANSAVQNMNSNESNSWPTTPGGTNVATSSVNNPVYQSPIYNGAQTQYGNNAAQQAFLNSYLNSLNPNTNFDINAQSSPYKNITPGQIGNTSSANGNTNAGSMNNPNMGKV